MISSFRFIGWLIWLFMFMMVVLWLCIGWLVWFSSVVMLCGVYGCRLNLCRVRWLMFFGWKLFMFLCGLMCWISWCVLGMFGRGSWIRMLLIFGLVLSWLIRLSSLVLVVLVGRL